MPKHQVHQNDPLELVGCVVDGDPSDTERMARCIVEEFLMMGWSTEQILGLFSNPFYRLPHSVYLRWGRERVMSLIAAVAAGSQTWPAEPTCH